MKKIIKTIKCLLATLVILSCTSVCTPNNEIKNSNNNLNKTLDLHAMAIKYEEIIKNDLYNPIDVYNGTLTGYSADCPLCSGKLGCNGQNVSDHTTTYEDSDYGTVRIVASSSALPCGSIVEFNLNKISSEPITAIVLDRGVLGTALDLLVESQEYALTNVGTQNISYNVLRYGYTR
jgi:hypothetical protein